MAKLHMDLRHYKKTKHDKHTATFSHPNGGHSFTIALGSLTPRLKKQLSEIPLAEGGEVKQDDVPEPNKANAAAMQRGATAPGTSISQGFDNIKKGLGFANGGRVPMALGGDAQSEALLAAPVDNPFEKKEEEKKPTPPGPAEAPTAGAVPIAAPTSAGGASELAPLLLVARGGQVQSFEGGGAALPEELIDLAPLQQEAPIPQRGDPEWLQNMQARGDAASARAMEQYGAPPAAAPTTLATEKTPAAPDPAPTDRMPASGMQTAPPKKDAYTTGAEQVDRSFQKGADAEIAQNAATVKRGEENIKALQDLYTNNNTKLAEIDQTRKNVEHDIANFHIDPDRLHSSMGTGQKIGLAISLILGGMGSGVTGGKNPAMEMLEKSIDRDIDAQKAELGKRENLLSSLLKQSGDLRESTSMTRIILTDLAAQKMQVEIAKTSDPLIQARMMKAQGELKMSTAPHAEAIAMQHSLNALTAAASADPSKAPAMLDAMQSVDPKRATELRERFVPDAGFANTPKDAEVLKEHKSNVDTAKSGVDALLRIQNKPYKSISFEDRAQAETIQQMLVGALRIPITGPGAMNEGERAMVERIIANPTAMFTLDNSNKVKLETLVRRLDAGFNAAAHARGIRGAPAPATTQIELLKPKIGK